MSLLNSSVKYWKKIFLINCFTMFLLMRFMEFRETGLFLETTAYDQKSPYSVQKQVQIILLSMVILIIFHTLYLIVQIIMAQINFQRNYCHYFII